MIYQFYWTDPNSIDHESEKEFPHDDAALHYILTLESLGNHDITIYDNDREVL